MPVNSYWVNVTLWLGFYVHVSGSVLFKGCCCVETENRDLPGISFVSSIPNSCNWKLSIKIWLLTASVWPVSKCNLPCFPWQVVSTCSGARYTSRSFQVSLRSLTTLESWWFHLQPTFLFLGWGTGNRSWKFGHVSQGNPTLPLPEGLLNDNLKWQAAMSC